MVGPAKNVVFGQIARFCNYLIPPYLPLPEIGVPLATLSCWRTQQMVKKHTQLVPILCVTKISTLYRQQVITGLEKHHVWLHIACFDVHKNSWKSPLKNTPCYMAKKKHLKMVRLHVKNVHHEKRLETSPWCQTASIGSLWLVITASPSLHLQMWKSANIHLIWTRRATFGKNVNLWRVSRMQKH